MCLDGIYTCLSQCCPKCCQNPNDPPKIKPILKKVEVDVKIQQQQTNEQNILQKKTVSTDVKKENTIAKVEVTHNRFLSTDVIDWKDALKTSGK